MTQHVRDFMSGESQRMRERLRTMSSEERERLLARRRRMLESMDAGARRGMMEHFAEIERRPSAPEVGAEAPDFDLAVLNGDGRRVRLKELRGKPVGLIFGSYT